MDKKWMLPVLLATAMSAVPAQTPTREAGKLVDALAATIADEQLSRCPVAVMEFRNASSLAEKHLVGQAFTALVETAVTDSLVFKLVDRKNLDRYLEEIELALSDPTGSISLDAGIFEEARYFIDGAVTEENGSFRVSTRLIRTDTAEIVAEAGASIAVESLVSLGESYGYQFVAANGVGMGVRLGPTYLAALYGAPPVPVGQNQEIGAALLAAGMSYRLSRGLRLDFGVDIDTHDVMHIDDLTYADVANMPFLTATVLDTMLFLDRKSGDVRTDTTAQILGNPVSYQITRMSFAGSLVLSPVLNMSRSLNLSAGAGPAFGMLNYIQIWDQLPIRTGDYVFMNRKEISRLVGVIGATAQAGVEWFVMPRLAVTIGARLIWLYPLPSGYEGWDSLTDSEQYYTSDDRSPLSFGLNPFMLPDGTPWSDSLFETWWAYAFVGITFYL